MLVGERRLVLEKSSRERWPPFPSNHPWKCSPFLPFILSLPPLPSYRDLRKEPRSRNKGGESGEETLILINCLIFLRDIRDALPPAELVYISLDHRKDVVPSLRWIRCIHDILLNDIVLRNLYIIGETQRLFDAGFFIKKVSSEKYLGIFFIYLEA